MVTGYIGDKGRGISEMQLGVLDKAFTKGRPVGTGTVAGGPELDAAARAPVAGADALTQKSRGMAGAARGGQSEFAGYLRRLAEGGATGTPAQNAFAQSQAANAQNTTAIAAGNRANPFAARRAAAMANDGARVQGAQQLSTIQANEQAGAQAMLGQYLSDMRGQDIQAADARNQEQLGYLNQAQQTGFGFANQQMQRSLAQNEANQSSIDRGLDLRGAFMDSYYAKRARQAEENAAFASSLYGAATTVGMGVAGAAGKGAAKAAAANSKKP